MSGDHRPGRRRSPPRQPPTAPHIQKTGDHTPVFLYHFAVRPSAPVYGPFLFPGVNIRGSQKKPAGGQRRLRGEPVRLLWPPGRPERSLVFPDFSCKIGFQSIFGSKLNFFYNVLSAAGLVLQDFLKVVKVVSDFCRKSCKSCESRETKIRPTKVVSLIVVSTQYKVRAKHHVIASTQESYTTYSKSCQSSGSSAYFASIAAISIVS